jgi:hypothetical protein
VSEFLTRPKKARKRNKRDVNSKEKMKLSSFADEMILYLKDPTLHQKNRYNVYFLHSNSI